MKQEQYIQNVLQEIRCKRAWTSIERELADHIEEQTACYRRQGMVCHLAEAKAVEEMGNPTEVGRELNRIHRPKVDWTMMFLVLVLVIFGILVQTQIVASADGTAAGISHMQRVIECNLIGMAGLFLVMRYDYRRLVRRPWLTGLILAIFCIALHMGNGLSEMANSFRWNVVMSLYVIWFACVIYQFRDKKWKGILSCVVIHLVATAFLMVWGNFSVGIFAVVQLVCLSILITAVAINHFGGRRRRYLGEMLGMASILILAFGVEMIAFSGQHLSIATNQLLANKTLLIAESGTGGVIYSLGTDGAPISITNSFFQGPGVHGIVANVEQMYCDYVIAEGFNILGKAVMLLLLIMIAVLFVRMFALSIRQVNRLGFLLSLSANLLLLCKSSIYLLVNIGLFGQISVDMPFLSYGFWNTLTNYILLGVILAVYGNTMVFGSDMQLNAVYKPNGFPSRI